ncbi:hypothetical protein [Streptomyces sp. NBC_01431]|uniref:hypothetical protein n=1 Tax=Streptomyces sp. NBC_01431 TaxID=2903863 RepID=UPI002E347B6C|nr:hypothetical protein [Streptomyces sp. NBC_01431]
MTTALTIAVTLLLIVGAARVIHLLNAQHSERIALHPYSRFHPVGRGTRGGPARPVPGLAEPPAVPTRRDQRDGGRGRLRPRRRIRHEHGR